MTGAAYTTTNHKEIQQWVEERNGKPAKVRGTEHAHSALLRIDFPGGVGEDRLEHLSWEEFFDIFERNNLAILYQREKKSGEMSTFFKLVSRDKQK